MKDPRRDEVQDVLLSADDDRVARVRAALVAHDAIGILREEVHKGQLDTELFRLFVEAEVPLTVFGDDALLKGSRSWPLK